MAYAKGTNASIERRGEDSKFLQLVQVDPGKSQWNFCAPVKSRNPKNKSNYEAATLSQLDVTFNRFLLERMVCDVSIEAVASNQAGVVI